MAAGAPEAAAGVDIDWEETFASALHLLLPLQPRRSDIDPFDVPSPWSQPVPTGKERAAQPLPKRQRGVAAHSAGAPSVQADQGSAQASPGAPAPGADEACNAHAGLSPQPGATELQGKEAVTAVGRGVDAPQQNNRDVKVLPPATAGRTSELDAAVATFVERHSLRALSTALRDSSCTEEERASRCADGLRTVVDGSCESPSMTLPFLTGIGAAELPEPGLLLLAQSFSKANPSTHVCAVFIRTVLLPRLQKLDQPASRALFTSVVALLEKQPSSVRGPFTRALHSTASARLLYCRQLGELAPGLSQVLDELVLPLLWLNGGALSAAQSEVLGRMMKEIPRGSVARLVEAFANGEQGQPATWSESQVGLMQVTLALKPPLSGDTLLKLLQQADANTDALRRSLKFSNLIFTLVKSYSDQLGPHVELATAIAEQLGTFLRKTTLSAIGRIKPP